MKASVLPSDEGRTVGCRIRGLYAITPDMTDTVALVAATRQTLEGGARLIQYRNKAACRALRLEQASSLARLCREFHVPLIINDHADLADEVGADGVHLGRGDARIPEARLRIGKDKIIGISCYNRLEYALQAEHQGADYVAFGAFFTSVTKLDTVPAPIHLLRQARRGLSVPIVAIGGITPENACQLLGTGADAVAVSNALFNAADIWQAARNFSCRIENSSLHNYSGFSQ